MVWPFPAFRSNFTPEGTLRISRLIYEGASDAAKKYDEISKAKKPRYRSRWNRNENGN